jgi:formylmethanofuran dehydrogenase subunit B
MTQAVWTCPFCPLACDHLGVRVEAVGAPLALSGGECARAQRALAAFDGTGPAATVARIDGRDASLDGAIDAAARLLAASRQPLFAGLATDVAGVRALYPLACATGAICDGDAALWATLRTLQDRGQVTATLAEVRTRADVIVFVGGLPLAEAPLIAQRCGIGQEGVKRHVILLGPRAGDEAVLAAWAGPDTTVQSVPLQGDLFSTLAALAMPRPALPWDGVIERLRAARYAVLVGAPSLLPRHGELVVEAVNRLVNALNRRSRAAALWLGASNANAVFAWLSGLPLRTRAGIEHEPWLFDTQRLLRDRAVDALLWVSSFEPRPPPPCDLPTVVLGPPPLAAACRREGTVFIAVSTPGLGSEGHAFRTDGTVLMPLHAVHDDALPTVADVAHRLSRVLARAAA